MLRRYYFSGEMFRSGYLYIVSRTTTFPLLTYLVTRPRLKVSANEKKKFFLSTSEIAPMHTTYLIAMIQFGLSLLLTFMWGAWAAVRSWRRRVVYPRVTRGLEISLVFFFRESKNTNRRKLYVINERGKRIFDTDIGITFGFLHYFTASDRHQKDCDNS